VWYSPSASAQRAINSFLAVRWPISIQVTSATKISRQGGSSAADLKSGDLVNVRAQTCKAGLANGATPSLTASRVVAHPAKA
jgi:hypothetical protein